MKRWLSLLLAAMLALGCAGCAKRQTVTVYRIADGGTTLFQTEAVTVADGGDPIRTALDALDAAPADSTCTNPVRGRLALDGYRVDGDTGTLWLTAAAADGTSMSGIGYTQALACLVLTCTAFDGVSSVGLEDADGTVLQTPLTANDLSLADAATGG